MSDGCLCPAPRRGDEHDTSQQGGCQRFIENNPASQRRQQRRTTALHVDHRHALVGDAGRHEHKIRGRAKHRVLPRRLSQFVARAINAGDRSRRQPADILVVVARRDPTLNPNGAHASFVQPTVQPTSARRVDEGR